LGNPLFTIYGWMPDTPMLALPFALATMLAWQRSRTTGRVGALAALACLTCLAGWQGAFMCLTLIAFAALDARRGRGWRVPGVLAVATCGTVAAVLAWSRWSYGSFDTLLHSAGYRVADGKLAVAEVARTQANFLTENWRLPVLIATPFGAVLAWRNRESRQPLLILTFVVVGYAALFWQAATIHRYWTVWAVAPVALCIGALCQALLDRPGLIRRNPLIIAVIAVALPLTSVVRTSAAEYEFELGRATRPAVDAPLAEGQSIAYAVGMVDPRWTTYTTHRSVERLDHEGLVELAAAHPEWRVLLNCVLRRVDHGPPPCTRLEDPDAVWADPLVATRADAALAAIESR
jgi:hypothetical protein